MDAISFRRGLLLLLPKRVVRAVAAVVVLLWLCNSIANSYLKGRRFVRFALYLYGSLPNSKTSFCCRREDIGIGFAEGVLAVYPGITNHLAWPRNFKALERWRVKVIAIGAHGKFYTQPLIDAQ